MTGSPVKNKGKKRKRDETCAKCSATGEPVTRHTVCRCSNMQAYRLYESMGLVTVLHSGNQDLSGDLIGGGDQDNNRGGRKGGHGHRG